MCDIVKTPTDYLPVDLSSTGSPTPCTGIVTVQPSEFVEEEGILPPMLRPWWAVVRPTEYAVDRGIAGGLALIFARSVGSRGKLERGIWWAWLPGQGFRKLSNGEVRNYLLTMQKWFLSRFA